MTDDYAAGRHAPAEALNASLRRAGVAYLDGALANAALQPHHLVSIVRNPAVLYGDDQTSASASIGSTTVAPPSRTRSTTHGAAPGSMAIRGGRFMDEAGRVMRAVTVSGGPC